MLYGRAIKVGLINSTDKYSNLNVNTHLYQESRVMKSELF